MRLGPLEIVIILVVVLVIFGATKMTDVGRRIGGGKGKSGGRASSETKATPIRYPRLQMTGIFIVVAGAIMLAISYGLFKLVGAVGIWAVVLISVGVTMVIISRRR
ncbi:MAG: twin-arginine translocase TatA/TatE family subunit [Dehalococcoidales bacterium]